MRHGSWGAVLTAVVLVSAAGCHPEGGPGVAPRPGGGPILRDVWPPRAVWVPRKAYTAPSQIADLMGEICDAGLNTVLWQVRGNGTAFYRSKIEPLAYEFRDGDPGFDPLSVACDEAHRRGLALHAWVNVMPGWRDHEGQGNPPADPRQLYNARPEWFWYDPQGRREPIPERFYVNVNPCLPEVREYLVSVFREIVGGYPVDGLHLDYIRFVTDVIPQGRDYPHDQATLALYRKATGKAPADDPVAWVSWRTQQVTQLVREIRQMLDRQRPGLILSASCAADLDHARGRCFQDGPAWVRGRLIDLAFVMNYTADTGVFEKLQEAWRQAAGGRRVAPGLGLYRHESDTVTIDQLKLADRWGEGLALFSSGSLFGPDPRSRARLEAIRPCLLEMKSRAPARAKAEADVLGNRGWAEVGGAYTAVFGPPAHPRHGPSGLVP